MYGMRDGEIKEGCIANYHMYAYRLDKLTKVQTPSCIGSCFKLFYGTVITSYGETATLVDRT